jgi:hypothetical protein
MAITTPALGGTTLPQVGSSDSYTETLQLRGSDVIMASGALKTDLVTTTAKRRFELRWKGLTEAQVSTVETAWATVKTATAAFTSPRGGSFTVTHDDGAMELVQTWYKGGGVLRADITMRLREV